MDEQDPSRARQRLRFDRVGALGFAGRRLGGGPLSSRSATSSRSFARADARLLRMSADLPRKNTGCGPIFPASLVRHASANVTPLMLVMTSIRSGGCPSVAMRSAVANASTSADRPRNPNADSAVHRPRVLQGRLDEDVESGGRARPTVCGERVRSDDEVANAVRVEQAKKLTTTIAEMRKAHRCRRASRALSGSEPPRT